MSKQTIENVANAFSVLVQAAELGQTKGIYSLADAKLICEAIDFVKEIAAKNVPMPSSDIDLRDAKSSETSK